MKFLVYKKIEIKLLRLGFKREDGVLGNVKRNVFGACSHPIFTTNVVLKFTAVAYYSGLCASLDGSNRNFPIGDNV